MLKVSKHRTPSNLHRERQQNEGLTEGASFRGPKNCHMTGADLSHDRRKRLKTYTGKSSKYNNLQTCAKFPLLYTLIKSMAGRWLTAASAKEEDTRTRTARTPGQRKGSQYAAGGPGRLSRQGRPRVGGVLILRRDPCIARQSVRRMTAEFGIGSANGTERKTTC